MHSFKGLSIEILSDSQPSENDVWPIHEHGVNVYVAHNIPLTRPKSDILLTDTPSLPLVHGFADCLPIIFFDPVHKAVCFTHAGWKGLTKGSIRISMLELAKNFGSNASDLQVWIGPCIHKESYVWKEKPFQLLLPAWKEVIRETEQGYSIDLVAFAIQQCTNLGIKQRNINLDERDTYTDPVLQSHLNWKRTGNEKKQGNFYIRCIVE